MKPLTIKKLSLAISLIFAANVSYAQSSNEGIVAEDAMPPSKADNFQARGFVSPKVGYFNNSGNPAYFNQYNFLESTFGDNAGSGFIADLDFSLRFSDDTGSSLFVEKEGYGENNQRFRLDGNFRPVRFKAYYSTFKTATGTFKFLYNPDMVLGGTDPRYADPTLNNVERSGYVASFTNDNPNVQNFEVRRNSFGGSLLMKPEVFNDQGSAELSIDGYTRQGNKVTNYLLPEFVLSSTLKNPQNYQWRGYDNPVNERDTKFTVNLNWTPNDEWFFNYEFGLDRFTNDKLPATFGDVAKWSGVPQLFARGVDLFTPLNFVPDSTQYSNSLRMTKSFGDTAAISAGVSYSWLLQDTYSEPQFVSGYNDGSTNVASAYLNGKFNVSQSVGLDAFVRYNQRQNDSSYPVNNFYEPVSTYLNPRMVAPRIDSYKNVAYGLEAKLYPRFLKTSWSAGWKYESKENELTWGTVPSLAPPLSLYGTKYSANEVFIKLVSRPMNGFTVRVTPSYLWADKTQLTTDPNEMFKFKSSVIYTRPEWNEFALTGYYNYSRKQNDTLSYSDYNVTPPGFADPQNQKTENTMQSFGVNFSIVPVEDLKLSLGYDWNQNDLSAYYFSTNRLRFDYPLAYPGVPNKNPTTPLDFLILDQFSYNVTSQTVTAGLEKQWSRYLFSANYSLMWANGNNGSGLAGVSLPSVDDKTDYRLHTLALGMEYQFKKDVSARAAYIYDRYEDNAYQSISGSRNTVWTGINYRF